jgi:DNA polymerase III delta prime subunit
MPHALITGVTESGKTTLARALSNELDKRAHRIIVYDPVGTPTINGDGWGKDAVIFRDKFEFLEYVHRDDVNHAHIFIDEAYEIFSNSDPSNNWLLTRGRHFGFSIYLMGVRPKILPPNVRTMCSTCYMFRLAHDDAKEICADFGHNFPEVLKDAENQVRPLDTGDYITLNSGSVKFSRANIFDQLSKGKK